MAAPIEDAGNLKGQTLHDQLGERIGKIHDVYAADGGEPMWVTVEASTGIAGSRTVFVPLARLKQEDDQIRVPYSARHLHEAPQVESGDELSPEQDRQLRDFYAIDHADQEIRTDNESYASQVPQQSGAATRKS